MTWNINRNRNVRKEITFTPEEWEHAEAMWKRWRHLGWPRWGAFARRMLMDGGVHVTVVEPRTDPKPIARAVDRIGVNVNQIARRANETGTVSQAEIAELLDSFARIERLLGRLFDDEYEARARAGKRDS